MTLIQPNRTNTFLGRTLIFLVILTVGASFWVVMLYNRVVNLQHSLFNIQSELTDLKTGNAELSDKIFAIFDNNNLERLAAERQLVKERVPSYFEIDPRALAVER